VIESLLKLRYLTFGVVVVLLVALAWLGKHVRYEQSIQSFFAEDDPAVVDYTRASALFGDDNFIFVCYEDPELLTPPGIERVAELGRLLGPENIPEVVRVESLDTMPLLWELDDRLIEREQKGFMRALRGFVQNPDVTVGRKIRSARATPESLDELKQKLTTHPLYLGTVIDTRGTTTAVVLRLKPMGEQEPKNTLAALRQRADAFAERHGLGRPALVGPPVLLADGYAAIEVDGQRLARVGMLLIGLVTLSATFSVWWAIVPLVAGWAVWLATDTLLAELGLRLSLSGGPLVAQIIVLTMPAASHLAIHFRDDRRKHPDRRLSGRITLKAVIAPIIWCALTGAIGYGALLTSNVVPIRQFGAVLGICTLTAAVLTLVIAPAAMLPPFPLEFPVHPGSHSRLATGLNAMTEWVCRHPTRIVAAVFALVLPLAIGIFRVKTESNYINAFKPTTRVVQDYEFVESRLGGIGVVALVVRPEQELGKDRDISVETLKNLNTLESKLERLRVGPERAVTSVMSLATVLDPDGRVAALPKGQAARVLKAKLALVRALPQSELLNGFWNRETGWARVMVRVVEQQAAVVKEATFADAERLAQAQFGKESFLTGLSYLLTQTTRGVLATQWTTFFWSAAGILLMMTIAFRGPGLALLALLPTMLAVGFVLGLMGWVGIKLDIATALVASVALGLSVDDTFHCLLQYRRHRAHHHEFERSLKASYAVTGPGVILSSLAVAAGFAVLRFSEFVPFSNFGTMVGIATAGSSVGNLVLLPACLALIHRWARGEDRGSRGEGMDGRRPTRPV
jgi:predicted RND superfamily exporter protein